MNLAHIEKQRAWIGKCILGFALTNLGFGSWTLAQEPIQVRSLNLVHFLQGEELRVTQDFVARLDGDKLRIALLDNGIARTPESTALMVTLIQPGDVPQEAHPDEQGELVFENVKSGLNVLLVMGSDTAAVTQSMTYAAFAFFAQAPTAVAPRIAAPIEPLKVPLVEMRSRSLLADLGSVKRATSIEDILPVEESQVTAPNLFRIASQPDGSLKGRVIVPQVGFDIQPGPVQIRLSQNNQLVAQSTSTDDGRFSLADLAPGFYSVSAVGVAGYAAFAFELVEPKVAQQPAQGAPNAEGHATRFVAAQDEEADELLLLLIPPAVVEQLQEVVRAHVAETEGTGDGSAPPLAGGGPAVEAGNAGGSPAAAAGNMFAGGGGVGGGGSGGGGAGGGAAGSGAGALLGAAGLAVGVAALANQDDGFNPPIASPIAPLPR